MEQARQEPSVAVIVVPLPAQGHLNQLLHFSLHLSSRGFAVHFACSSTHNRQARSRLQGWDPTTVENVEFHDLPLPHFSSPPADPNSPNKFPSHLVPAFEAAMQLQAPLASLFRSLSSSSRRLVIIHDPLMSYACSGADALPNAETYRFQCISASYQLSMFADELEKIKDKLGKEVRHVALADFEDSLPADFMEFYLRHRLDLASEAGTVMNTCRAIDGEFIDWMVQLPQYRDKKIFAIGPINPVNVRRVGHECLDWLDTQPEASVVYVSFGSTTSISDDQIEQLAIGLERSGQRFIWVLKDADRGDIFAGDDLNRRRKLPAGFEERVEGVGLVVRGWAPQLDILAHPSTGAFVSHCGWNSCMESLSMGVPIIAWPMHGDQPRDAMMVSEYLKVGVTVRDWARHKEVVSASEIETSIKRIMVDDEGKEIRSRATSLGVEVRLAVGENGSSRADFDAFINHVTRG